jgi:two-component system sensor histidine kinase/response regulator
MQFSSPISPRKARSLRVGFWTILAIVVVIGYLVDRVNINRLQEVARTNAYEEVSLYRALLENELNSNLQMVRGLAIAVSEKHNLDQASFERIASPLFAHSKILRNIGAAPNMVIAYMHPLEGNEKAIGLDYNTIPAQRDDALRARDSKDIVLAGPLTLVQGGEALIARVPVFDSDTEQFWGLLSVVIDIDKLYNVIELQTLLDHYDVGLRKLHHADSPNGGFFLGNKAILERKPLALSITLPQQQNWELYALPKKGWEVDGSSLWSFRLTVFTFLCLFIAAFKFIDRIIRQIQDNEQHLNTMSHLVEVGAWSLDLKTQQVFCSDVTLDILETQPGFKPSWLSSIDFFAPGHNRRRIQELMAQTIKGGVPFEEEFLALTAKGKSRWITVKAFPKVEKGRTVEVVGSVQNIDARKSLEIEHEKIARHNELLAKLSTHEAVLSCQYELALQLITDATCSGLSASRSTIWQFNADATKLSPVSFSHTKANSWEQFPPWRESAQHALFAAIKNNELIELPLARRSSLSDGLIDNYLIPFNIQAIYLYPIKHHNNIIGVMTSEYSEPSPNWTANDRRFLQSLTTVAGSLFANKETQKARQQALVDKKLAEQSAAMKAEFLASMSHEIRTPMNGILGMLELLQQTHLNPSQRHQIHLAQSSAQSLLVVINDILDFSKIEAGKIDIEKVDVNLVELVSETFESFALKAAEKQILLEIDCRNLLIARAKTDPHRLRQILNNLISNAVKFTDEGRIILTCYSEQSGDETRLWCSIEDTGIGIAKEKLATIFDSFTQADSSTTRKYGGTGLGLSIARQLCELLGGSLSAYSKLNVGSTFTFFVVLEEPEPILPLEQMDSPLLLLVPSVYDHASLRHILSPWHVQTHVFHDCDSLMVHLSNSMPADLHLVLDPVMITSAESAKRLSELLDKHDLKVAKLSSPHTQHNDYWPNLNIELDIHYPLTPANALSLYIGSVTDNEPIDTHLLSGSVLLVEDNKVNQIVATSLLSKLGLTVTIAQDGVEALHMLKQQDIEFDLILMDCLMPNMDGYETTMHIRAGEAGENNKKRAIIALTANAMVGDKEKCLAAGMDSYLSKPLQFEDLASTVRAWLGQTSTINK